MGMTKKSNIRGALVAHRWVALTKVKESDKNLGLGEALRE